MVYDDGYEVLLWTINREACAKKANTCLHLKNGEGWREMQPHVGVLTNLKWLGTSFAVVHMVVQLSLSLQSKLLVTCMYYTNT